MNGATVGTADRVIGRADEMERLAHLFDAHADRLYRLARRLVQTADDAKDLVQETFAKAAMSVRSIPVGHEEAWLVRVMVNLQRDAWRKSVVRQKSTPLIIASATTQRSSVESTLAVHQTVWNALDALAPRRRAIVVLRELDGIEVPEIARLLGIGVMTVRWHLSMARRELRTILRPFVEEHR